MEFYEAQQLTFGYLVDFMFMPKDAPEHTHTHTHTHIYIYIYIHTQTLTSTQMCVCVNVGVCVYQEKLNGRYLDYLVDG